MLDPIQTRLHSLGFRMTPQRLAIYNIILEAGNHLTALEIYDRAQQRIPAITEATIYRNLSFLTAQGIILAAHVGGGQLVYEIAGYDHHHLICRNCGSTREIDHQLLTELYQEFQARTGYCIDGMHVTFFGLCPQCQREHSGMAQSNPLEV
jgi:Fe2+ or Zn2+ uptake regulation protein